MLVLRNERREVNLEVLHLPNEKEDVVVKWITAVRMHTIYERV